MTGIQYSRAIAGATLAMLDEWGALSRRNRHFRDRRHDAGKQGKPRVPVQFLIGQRFHHEQTPASIERAVERRGNEADRLPGLPPWRDAFRGIAAARRERAARVGVRPPRVVVDRSGPNGQARR